jgi:hypothetical protein
MLGLVGQRVRLLLRGSALGGCEGIQEPQASQALDLLEFLHRHHGRQRPAFPLNDELVVPERHPVEKIAKPLPQVQRRKLLDHGVFPNIYNYYS